MEALSRLVFEDPSALYWALGLAQAIMLVMLYFRRTRRVKRLALLPAVLAGIVVLVAALVTTERERLGQATGELVGSFREVDLAAMEQIIASDFADRHYDKAELLEAAKTAAGRFPVETVEITAKRVELDGDTGKVRVWVTLDAWGGGRKVPTVWTLWWARRDGQWQLTSIRLEEPTVPLPPKAPRAPSGPPATPRP